MATKAKIPRNGNFPSAWWSELTDRGIHFDTVGFLSYLWTCDHHNIQGIYWLPVGYIMTDSKLDPSDIERRLGELDEAGLIMWDRKGGVLLLVEYMRYQSNLYPAEPSEQRPDPRISPLTVKGIFRGVRAMREKCKNGTVEKWSSELLKIPPKLAEQLGELEEEEYE